MTSFIWIDTQFVCHKKCRKAITNFDCAIASSLIKRITYYKFLFKYMTHLYCNNNILGIYYIALIYYMISSLKKVKIILYNVPIWWNITAS